MDRKKRSAGPDPLHPHAGKSRLSRWLIRPATGFRNNFLAGLVVVVPIAITIWLIWTFVGWIDSWVMPFVPGYYHPDAMIDRWLGNNPWFVALFGENFHINIRGVGVVFFLFFTSIVGWIAKGVIGRSLLTWGEGLVDRMPIVRSLYSGVKQIAETVFAQQEAKFDRACLVEYPRKGLWAIAFVSTSAKGEIDQAIPVDEPLISVFLPTTPNPTSGFLLFVPQHSLIYLDMSVEDAAKLVISAGLVYPNGAEAKAALDGGATAGAPAAGPGAGPGAGPAAEQDAPAPPPRAPQPA